MEKEKLEQIKFEEREKTRLAKLEKKYGNKRLKRLADECGYGFRYKAWLEAQGDEDNALVASVVFGGIGLLMAIVALILGANTYSYFIFYILGYYFLVAMQIERQKVNSHFDAIISAFRYHSLRNVIEAYKFLEEEVANEKERSK